MSTVDGLRARIRAVFGRRRTEPLDPERDDIVVVVSSFDDAEACSAALDRGAESEPGWRADAEAVLRHHLELPTESVPAAVELAGQAGYLPAAGPPAEDGDASDRTRASLILQRVQVLDALHCAQEKSRMASLAQRLGGTALGWDALQPRNTAD